MAAMAPATASRPWPLPRVLLNIPADASRLALLQPAARVDRVAVAAQFEIQRRPALAAGIADAGDRIAALDLRPGVLEQGVVVGVQAHVAVAVVDDQDQPVTGHPLREQDRKSTRMNSSH